MKSKKSKPPEGEGWTEAMPDTPGQWQMACAEGDFEAQVVTIFKQNGELWVMTRTLGQTRWTTSTAI